MTELSSAIKRRILIVDDIFDNVQVLGRTLAHDYEVQFATSGPEAISLIEQQLPDLILLDVMMPEMNGYEVFAWLSANPRTQNIPVIFVTACNDSDSETHALAAGAVDFIHKPINRLVVRARVNTHLALRQRGLELEQLNAELERRVEERTQALQDALIRAEAAHRAKNQFLANINHELRTPMNAILGLSSLMGRQTDDPRLSGRISKIDEAGRRLLGIINDIIDMSDCQADMIQIDSVDFDLPTVVDQVCNAWQGRAEAKSLAVSREIDPAIPQVLRGDPMRLRQILGNLLGNAVKFSEQGHIVLRARLTEEGEDALTLRFEVEDHGTGIDLKRQASIFNAFEQADNSTTRSYGGAGLGLAICKQLTELMGGKIGVSSAPGLGSLFWFNLPLKRYAAPAEQALASPLPEGTRVVDWRLVRQTFFSMTSLLTAEDYIQAYIMWSNEGHVLETVLGDRANAFNHAMEAFDLATALVLLRAAGAAHPQLAIH